MGFHTRPPMDYAGGYWSEYVNRDASQMGEALTAARVALVDEFGPFDGVCDIGIGGGRFVTDSGASGFDVNPDAVAWLRSVHRYRNPYVGYCIDALTFWDSLEHIPDPAAIVARAGYRVYVSMPIYADLAGVLASPHYKPGEHLWYWTRPGLELWFERQGFRLLHADDRETQLGRRGIMSFVFQRVRS